MGFAPARAVTRVVANLSSIADKSSVLIWVDDGTGSEDVEVVGAGGKIEGREPSKDVAVDVLDPARTNFAAAWILSSGYGSSG